MVVGVAFSTMRREDGHTLFMVNSEFEYELNFYDMKHLLLKKMIFLSTQLYTPGCVCSKRDLFLGTKKADRK